MAKILRNIDKIITSNNTVVDLDNITGGLIAVGGTESDHTDSNGQNWKVHTFTDDGDFVVSGSGLVEYVIVGGGGGGGAMHYGGGGGAGGFLTNIQAAASGGGTTVPSDESLDMSISSGTYAVSVGVGGAGYTGYNSFGRNGLPSSFNGVIALGGGVGLATNSISSTEPTAHNGGSGGGSSSYSDGGSSYAPGSGTVGQGYRGGYSQHNSNNWGAAGGGGAGDYGGNSSAGVAGNGGIGCSTIIRNTTPETLAGGGGGGTGYFTNVSTGIGGDGGGGSGASYNSRVAADGAANTGGGGGGSCHSNDNPATNYCGAGGSGIVIIRYKA